MEILDIYDGDVIYIGDNVKLVIDRCVDDGKTTRLGIEAPKDITILREELYNKPLGYLF